ncbi:MAG: glucosyltransferase domain-containing protein [Syntrophobacteraceae bacterium]
MKALSILLALFAVFHVSELTNFTLSIEDEFAAFQADSSVWVAQGRRATYLFEKFVLPQPVVPFLPLALFGLFCSIGYLFFLRAIGERHEGPSSFAFFPLFSTFPIWAFLTAFQSNMPSCGIGVLLTCWAASLYRKEREQSGRMISGFSVVWHIALIGFLGAIATACYQSFILFLAVALLASLIAMHLFKRPARLLPGDCFVVLAILVTSMALYILILKFFLVITNTKIVYIQLFVHTDLFFHQPKLVISNLFNQMADVYFGGSAAYGSKAHIFAVLIFVAAAGLVHRAHRIAGLRGAFFAGLAFLALLVAPFGVNLINGGNVPLRSLVAVPAALASLGLLGFKYASRWLSRIGIFVLVLAYFAIFQILSGFNAARELVPLHDHEMAGALSERIARIASSAASERPITLEVVGYQAFQTPFPRINNSTIGASFFYWDWGKPCRITTYMKLIGLPAFNVEPPEGLDNKRLDEFVLMPSWLAQDSVRAAADGTILVKLSEVLVPRYRQLLASKDPSVKAGDEPLYRLSTADVGSWSLQNALVSQKTSEGIVLKANSYPNFTFKTGASQILENCSRIEMHARLKIERTSNAQIFYKIPGQTDFQGDAATDAPISPAADGGFVDVNLQAVSSKGFEDSFKFYPVKSPQHVTIGEIELFCRHQRPCGKE